ncbi:N-formylglutamate amidohydrolase [Pseudotamlana agarivorans]|uniref:N-formylglutamate amidohydrolase n=1 Tax=Pseudotamlana agarivorans TaxID=481183 RepID=UPI00082A587F|nr:N-formylglutamate amidohydrolase [Tamlana agarivorans]
MERLTIKDIISKIGQGKTFEAVSSDYAFTIKIDKYVPYVCAAIHDGHQFRKELWDNCMHTEYERWYEEDPETKSMIHSHPIVIAGCDSRFEYDLNRAPEEAVFETAWGKKLWFKPLSKRMKAKSLRKHANFYKVVHQLIEALEAKFGFCTVYDIHSYNWKRWERDVPTWNIGTANIDTSRFKNAIKNWRRMLSNIKFPYKIKSTAKVNDTFQGNGYFLKYITTHFKNTLVLATEISKIYVDEKKYITFPEIVNTVEEQLKVALPKNALENYKNYSNS